MVRAYVKMRLSKICICNRDKNINVSDEMKNIVLYKFTILFTGI